MQCNDGWRWQTRTALALAWARGGGVAWLRSLLAIMLLAATLLPARAATVPVLQVGGAISPASADYVIRGLAQAAAEKAPLVVIELDTPGGLDSSMRQIIQAMLDSPVPVAVYVAPQGSRAASAGTYILYAAQLAVMAPATTLGAATPVAIGIGGSPPEPPAPVPGAGDEAGKKGKGDEGKAVAAGKSAATAKSEAAKPAAPPGDAMSAKRINDAAAYIRGLAQLRGRNGEWAERAVREAVSLTAAEAQQQKVIDFIAPNLPDLLAQADGRTVEVAGTQRVLHTKGLPFELRPPGWRLRLLAVIANPSVAMVLMMIGFYGLVLEFSTPGQLVPGIVGAICLLLGLFALQMLPVNYAGLALLLLGVGLLAAELFTPAYGALGTGGFFAIVGGGLLLFDDEGPGWGVPLWLPVLLAGGAVAVVLLGGGMALKARRRPVVSGREAMVGAVGEVLSLDGENTWALVRGERWKVRSPQKLVPGQHVRVLALDGLELRVQPEPD